MADPLTLAWIAGFFDGEGCVQVALRRDGRSMLTRLTITNTDIEALELIQSRFAGKIYRQKQKKNRPCYSLEIAGPDSDVFARAILPYSRTKRPQLELFLHARTLIVKPHGATEEAIRDRQEVARAAHLLKHDYLEAVG